MGRTARVVAVALTFPVLLGAQERPHPLIGKNYAEGLGRIWVQRAMEAAVSRLQQPGCRQLFSDFSDGQGVPVVQKLEALGVTPDEYLTRWICFVEGSRQQQCRNRDVAAFTQPGSRVIYVCSSRVVAYDTPYGDMVIIHEMLHSLGLRENPPTSREITKRVLKRCAR
jgi:hypothetical protein